MDLEQLKYPIGRYVKEINPSATQLKQWIENIETFPKELTALTNTLKVSGLQWKYRPEGWNIKQVIHHCADSHMNSYIRFKLTLTEDKPTVKTYSENAWATLIDANADDIHDSVILLTALHRKWVMLLKNMSNSDLKRCYMHPEMQREVSLVENVGLYSWHCQQHLAHIKNAIEFQYP